MVWRRQICSYEVLILEEKPISELYKTDLRVLATPLSSAAS